MKLKLRKIRWRIIVSICILITILALSSSALTTYLTKNKKIDANILVIEGWLSDAALLSALNEFKSGNYQYIITTGNYFPDKYFNVYSKGYLIFYLKDKLINHKGFDHTIDVYAYSELDGEHRAHFNVLVNDTLVADFYATKKKKKYRINWYNDLSSIDSVVIHFDNDNWGDWGDRNLFIKGLLFDNRTYIPYQYNTEYQILDSDNKPRILNNYGSNAELARIKLLTTGVDSEKVIAVPGKKTILNRTLASAKAFSKWLKTSNIEVKGINIASQGTHAKRTWLIYRKVLGQTYKTGIISMPSEENMSKGFKIFKVIRELAGILYYSILLVFY